MTAWSAPGPWSRQGPGWKPARGDRLTLGLSLCICEMKMIAMVTSQRGSMVTSQRGSEVVRAKRSARRLAPEQDWAVVTFIALSAFSLNATHFNWRTQAMGLHPRNGQHFYIMKKSIVFLYLKNTPQQFDLRRFTGPVNPMTVSVLSCGKYHTEMPNCQMD